MRFKKFGGDYIFDVGEYLREYLTKYPNTSIYVGTDSSSNRHKNFYATVIAMYDLDRKDGVHYVYTKKKEPKEKDVYKRMMNEVSMSMEVAELLEVELEGYLKRFTSEELVGMFDENKEFYKAHQTKLCTIDLDINPDAGGGKNQSNKAYDAAKGWVVGSGYRARFKPHSWAARCAADMVCKS